jgi:hypothetical protein
MQELQKKMKIGLISCVSKKRKGKYKARDLYKSPLFSKSYQYAKTHYDKVYILFAKYGLVHEEQEIEDYDLTLNKMSKEDIIKWSSYVAEQINNTFNKDDEIYIIAGKKYYSYLISMIRNKYTIVMKDMPIGKRLKWLNENG